MGEKKETYSLLVKFVATLKHFYKTFFFVIFISVISSGLAITYPLIFKEIATHFQNRAVFYLFGFVLLYAVIQLVQDTIQSFNAYIRRKYAINANKKVINHFYDKVQSLTLKRFKRFEHNGEIYQRVIDSLDLNHLVIDVASGLFIIALNLIIYLLIVSFIHWTIGLAIMAFIPAYYLLNKIYSPKLRELQELSLLNNSPLTNHLFDCLNRIITIKALGAKDQVMKETKNLIETNAFHNLNLTRYSVRVSWVNKSLTNFFNLLIISLSIFLVIKGQLTVANGLVVLVLVQRIFDPLQTAFEHFVDLNRAYVILKRYFEILDEKSEEESQKSLKPIQLNKPCSIKFKNINFAYDTEQVIKNLNLEILQGKRVAFVGRTGVGKSTLMNLILGLYKPQDGNILINSENINDIDLTHFRKQIGVVLQNEYIFPGTVYDNVIFGLEREVTEEEVKTALKNACLWSTIEKLPKGLKTKIKDDSLSGGEKQRLTIARAFLRDPRLILFDEPTSALDLKTEAQIQEAMDRLLKGRTSITIAHRLSTIKKNPTSSLSSKTEASWKRAATRTW